MAGRHLDPTQGLVGVVVDMTPEGHGLELATVGAEARRGVDPMATSALTVDDEVVAVAHGAVDAHGQLVYAAAPYLKHPHGIAGHMVGHQSGDVDAEVIFAVFTSVGGEVEVFAHDGRGHVVALAVDAVAEVDGLGPLALFEARIPEVVAAIAAAALGRGEDHRAAVGREGRVLDCDIVHFHPLGLGAPAVGLDDVEA